MTTYDNKNRGVLFVNDKKEDGDKKPDRTGSLNVDGVEYFLDGWIKKSDSGKTFMSVSIKRKDKQTAPAAKSAPGGAAYGAEKPGNEPGDDDVPFITSCMSCDMTTSKQRRMMRYEK